MSCEWFIRSDIRNPWAHCDFIEWTATKYADSFQLMGQLISNLSLSNREENRILGELNRWAMNGQHFLSGTTLGLEIVGDIRQQTHVLSRYVQTLCSETDSQFIRVKKQLSRIENDLQEHEEKIKSLESKTKKHDESFKEVIKQVEDHIPQHIRAHHEQEIREWEQDQTTFLETRATHHILESLTSHNCIVVTGSSSCGKSSNIHQAALHLRDSLEYEIIPVLTGPTDIMNYYNENRKQVFVVDDICGKETINTQTLQMWRDYSEKMEKIFKVANKDDASKIDCMVSKVSSPKLLMSCRLHIYKESQFQHITLFTKKACNLSSPELCLQDDERLHMLRKYLSDDIIAKLNLKQVTENLDYFPFLCKLSKDKTSEEVKTLFKSPLGSIKRNIHNIINENKDQFCALTLTILFGGEFNTEWLTQMDLKSTSETTGSKLEEIVNEFDIDLSKERQRNSLKSGFATLSGTYLKQRGSEYRMIHDKIYKIAALICGQHLTKCFIKYAPSVFIRDNFIFESLLGEHDDSIVIFEDQEEDYFERLVRDLKKHVISSTFNNNMLRYKSYRGKLISYLRRSDETKLCLKKIDLISGKESLKYTHCSSSSFVSSTFLVDKLCYASPLLEIASHDFADLVNFLISINFNVNVTDHYGSSPLHKASKSGHISVVRLLLESNADVFQLNNGGESALYVACKGLHTEIVNLLLQYNANASECNIHGESPLFVACKGGHTNIARLLLQNNADVNQYSKMGESPLFVACKGGHTDIVELLLQHHADFSKCNNSGESPMDVACAGGNTDIVKLLLQDNVDVSQVNYVGKFPLYVACELGHTHTVNMLLQNKADVNQSNSDGESSLYVACKRGYTGIVKTLLHNNADFSQSTTSKRSPLFVACEGGHTDTVKVLLEKNADVSQCTISERSPLFVACEGGHTDTVELLLENNADVSQCNSCGQSPLFVAREKGHTDIEELLLMNGADISQVNVSGKFVLNVANVRGHSNSVKMVLQDNTGVSKCYHEKKLAMDTVCELPHTGSLLLTPIVCDGIAIDVMVDKRLIDSHNVRKKTTKGII
ncbi:Hypothetical predicted protein [Mytilus galloprovincialis]|uniref:Novel STAND NTPase 3 domain-containing protein n=1 Tax=Mytilus galloprovincialis TaxID=29158 RepID=A0A8B6BFM7_MYTGA|nr:Hypothetical predicted protein [Mytilus galloprovincialis]